MLMIMNFKKHLKGEKVSKHWRCDHKIRVQILGGRPGWRSINASGSAVYPRERAWSVLSNEGKAVSQYLSQFPNILSCVGGIR